MLLGFDHLTVNHSLHFYDSNNASIHANTVEGMRHLSKQKFKKMHGTSRELFGSYLQEFMWRRRYENHYFVHLLVDIASIALYILM